MLPALDLNLLREHIGAIATASRSAASVRLATGDALRLGAVHEWFGVEDDGRWLPPLAVLTDIARRARTDSSLGAAVWIGRRAWPHARFLSGCACVLRSSVFIDPPDDASRLWAIDTALRCESPTLVIADGARLTLAHTRRLQLAAGCGRGLCALARPAREQGLMSAATTRWHVGRAVSSTGRARWTIALLRNKDKPALMDDMPVHVVEWNDAQGLVGLPPTVAHRADCTQARAS